MKLKIGIDIDGVLNNQYDFCIQFGTKFCNELKNKYKLENLNVADTTDMFLWPDSVAHKFWNKYRRDLVYEISARIFASEVIKKLRDNDYEIYIITARKNKDEWFPKKLQNKVEKITKKWLKKNKIYYDKIYFNIKDKGEFCKDNHISIMIDDEPRNIEKLKGNTNIIIFDAPYNRKEEYKDIIRAYSWYDIYDKIYKIINEEKK